MMDASHYVSPFGQCSAEQGVFLPRSSQAMAEHNEALACRGCFVIVKLCRRQWRVTNGRLLVIINERRVGNLEESSRKHQGDHPRERSVDVPIQPRGVTGEGDVCQSLQDVGYSVVDEIPGRLDLSFGVVDGVDGGGEE